MNRQRKERFNDVLSLLDDAKAELEDIQAEEQEAFDNLSEGLQCSQRGDTMQSWLDIMDEIGESIDKLADWIKSRVFNK